MQSVLVSLLSCHVLPPCSESRREVQKLSVGMQQILSNITRFLGSYVGILLQLCCNCRVCIEWKVLPPLPVRCGGGNKNWGYKLRRARSMTNCEKAGTGWLGCPIKDAIQCHLYHVYIYISIQQIIQVKAHFRTSMCYRWMWKSVLFAIERFISMRESNWGKSVLFAFSLGFAWQLESGTFKSCSNFHGYTNGNYGI